MRMGKPLEPRGLSADFATDNDGLAAVGVRVLQREAAVAVGRRRYLGTREALPSVTEVDRLSIAVSWSRSKLS